jgi:hypothetical protein
MVHSPWRENVRSDEVETHGVVGDEGEIIPSNRTQLKKLTGARPTNPARHQSQGMYRLGQQ